MRSSSAIGRAGALRIVILSQYYAPEPIPKPVELARALRDRGHDVTVVTGFPNYPSGRLYRGYRLRPRAVESIDGITVIRTFEFPYHGLRVAGRALNYFSFALSAPWAASIVGRADVIYVWHPPLTVGLAAWALGRLCRAPFVYDVQDIWPEAVLDAGSMAPGVATRGLRWLERFVYARAAHLITATEPARRNLIDKGVPAAKVSVLPHWIDPSAWTLDRTHRREVRAALGWADRFVVLFAGNMGRLQALDSAVLAARDLAPGRFRLTFVGDGSERQRLQELVRANRLEETVEFLPSRPASAMPELFAATDAVLVHLKRADLASWTIPTKTLAYLAAGLPTIVAASGPTADLVRQADAGVIAPPEDPAALARVISALAAEPPAALAAMGARGQQYAAQHMARDRVIPDYEALLVRAAGTDARRSR